MLYNWPESLRVNDTRFGSCQGLNVNGIGCPTVWELGLDPRTRPAHVARFQFGAAGAPETRRLERATVRAVASGSGSADGGVAPGVALWVHDLNAFMPAVERQAPGELSWTTEDPALLQRLFDPAQPWTAFALSPAGAHGLDGATLEVDYVELVVRYARH